MKIFRPPITDVKVKETAYYHYEVTVYVNDRYVGALWLKDDELEPVLSMLREEEKNAE